MKKLLLVFCITLSFIIPALPSHAQTLDWSCFTTNGAVLADANDIATVAFTNANCPAANGFSLQIVGTGQLRTIVSNPSPGTNPFIRMSKNGATAVFNYARLFRTSGGLFTLTSISVTPSTVGAPPVGPGPQAITVHAYRSGTEVGTASTAILSTFGLVNIPSAQLGANFANIDEVRFTTSGANGFGVCIDDVVVAVAGNAPSVTTGLASAVTANSATLVGNVSSDGGAAVSEKGIVYSSTSSNPTTADAKLTNGTSIGAISVNATGLLSNTNYHFRAYATNVIGTSYGADQTFKTLVTNTAPVAVADNYNFQTGVTLSVAAPGVLNNDTDADGDPITAVLVSGPSNGTLVLNPNGSFNYTPSGTTADQFTYKVNDGKVDGNTVMVTLTHANAAPVLAATAGTTLFSGADALIDPGITVTDDGNVVASGVVSIIGGFHSPEDELALMRDVSMGDIVGYYDGGTGVLLLQSPSGTATIAQWQATLRRVVYRNGQGTPTVNTRTISFLVSDGSLNSNTVTKTVSIALPVAVADNYIYQSGTALTIAAPGVLGNDTSPGGSPLSAVLVTGPTNGTLVLNPNGSFTYTSTGATSDQFTYKVNNGNLDGNTVAVTLTRGNSSPVAVNDTYTVTANTPFSGNVFNNDSDPDGDQLLITANTSPAHGTLALNPNGSFTYTPNSTVGDDTFNYQVCDNGIPSLCSSATVVFHVSAPANQPPVVTTTAGATIFTGASAVAIDNAITVTDLDNNTLASAFIEITHGFHPSDVLGFTASGATGNITGSYDSTNGILPLTSAGASATLAQWQAALRSVTYQSTAAVPNTDTRLISFGTNDGNKASATVTKNITIAVPVISTTGTLSALTTTYGTASSSGTFNVSGVSLGAGILVTAPTGFEVSKDDITFSNTVIVGSTGTIPSTPVHIRLVAGINAGNYSGNVVLSSTGTNSVNVATVASTVNKAQLTITANSDTKVYGAPLPALAVSYSGFVGTDNASGLTTAPTISTTAVRNSPVNTYPVTASGAVSSNYTFVYQPGTLTVTPAALTITANNKGKAFGQALTGGPGSTEFTSAGLVNSEAIGSVTITYGTGAAAGAPVNTYTGSVVASAATGGTFNAGNYAITYVAGNITVGQAVLTITANDANKVYGALVPTFTVSYSGFIGTDDASSLTTQPTISTTAVAKSPVNTYPITVSGAVSSNYTIVYNPGTLTVTPAPLTITANSNTKIYGAPVPALAVSYSGFVGTDDASSLTTQPAISTTAVTNSPVNTYPITASGAVSSNYTIVYKPGILTVTPAALTITANNATKTYGSVNPALGISYSGFVGTDNAGSLTTQPIISTTAVTNSPVNTYPITASGAVSSNYTFVYQPGTLTVTRAALTITANNKGKAFGQTLTGAAGSTAFTSTGLVNTETVGSVTITYGTGAAAGAPANTYSGSVVASAATGGTFNANNYTIAYVAGNIIVGQAVLTITANNATKTYGSAVPALTVSYSGFVGTDDASSLTTQPTISTTAVTNSPVNTYPITASGAVSANYTIVYNPGILTVTPATLTITANNATKTYGSANPTFGVSYSGFVGTDNASNLTTAPTVSTTAVTNSPVNTYPITASGAVSANYTIVYKPGVLTVTTATLTITANNATKTYGSANPTFGVSYSGFVGSDNASSLITAPTVSTTAVTNSPVNTYPITASGAVSANYTIVYKPGVLTVTPAALTITANNTTKTYGSVNPALSVSYSGFVGTDNAASLTVAPVVSTTAVTNSPVNTYPITVSGAVSANYTIVYKPGVLTVTTATLIITANNATKSYGSTNPTLGVSYSGFVGTDNSSSLTTAPTVSTTAVTNSPVNTYPITASGAVSANYTFIYKPGILTVTPAALTITANNKTKSYSQALTGGAGSTAFTSTGLVGSETIGSVTITYGTGAAAGAAVNTYTGSVVASAATGGTFTPGNYHITYVAGDIIVGKSVLTIIANNATKTYGSANPALSVSYSGFVGTDNASSLTTAPTVSTTAVTNSPVNTYPITTNGAVSSNYTIVYKPGVLTVTPAALTITANSATKTYGSANPTLGVSYSGFVGSDNASSLTTAPTVGTTAVNNSPVNTYPITASGAVSSNYTIVYKPGVLTITPAALTITANNKTKVYGETLTGGAGNTTFTSTGLVNSETIGSVTITYGTGAAAGAAVNTYTGSVVASAATGGTFAPGNYHITYIAGNIVVNQVTLTITANSQSKIYGAANPVLSVSYSGFINGDNSASLTTKPSLSTAATSASAAGTYPITASGSAIANYKIVYIAGALTINKATLTITADNKSRLYGIANPALTATYSGFVNRDDEASLTTRPILTTAANTTSAPGVYPIGVNGAVSSNYNFIYVPGKLTVTPISNANLINLSLNSGILSPAFTSGNLAYTAQVDNDVDHIRLTLTFDATATARVNGTLTPNDRPSYSIPLNTGNNTITIVVTAQDRTTTNTYTVMVYRGADQKDLVVTNILTPNGDGKNDTWIIQDIQLYPNNVVTVYDRGGRVVYTKRGYTNDWNGTYSGSPLTEGTYYYVVDLGPQQRKFKGYITIVRNR